MHVVSKTTRKVDGFSWCLSLSDEILSINVRKIPLDPAQELMEWEEDGRLEYFQLWDLM